MSQSGAYRDLPSIWNRLVRVTLHTSCCNQLFALPALYGDCGEKITLAVQDHGPGIPDAEKARVFDRFYSADPSRTDKHNFGLGLSVAKELARLHHADLTVTDTPGGGAKFAVTFAARIS